MIVAVIPARGGSKRIPGKNIREFAGHPIMSYSIEAAKASQLFDRIIVSTDDTDIAAMARKLGAETPFVRPVEISDDHTGTNAVVQHAIEWLTKNDKPVSYACCIYATAPFVRPRYLREGFELLRSSNKSFAFSVTSFAFPVQRAIRIGRDGELNAMYPEMAAVRSQDLEEAYHDAGQFYWGRASAFLSGTPMFSPESIPVILPRYLVQDIDTMEDWHRAELMYDALRESGFFKNVNASSQRR